MKSNMARVPVLVTRISKRISKSAGESGFVYDVRATLIEVVSVAIYTCSLSDDYDEVDVGTGVIL